MKTILLLIFSIILIISVIFHFTTDLGFELFGMIKPITVIQSSGFIVFALILNKFKPFFLRLKKPKRELLIIFAFAITTVYLFEMLWSFGYWFSTYEIKVIEGMPGNSLTLDTLNYNPVREYLFYKNTSLNSSAKFNTLMFMMGIYSIWFLGGSQCSRR